MAIWHIFYKSSDKEISWCTNGNISEDIKTEQANAGLSYLEKDTDGFNKIRQVIKEFYEGLSEQEIKEYNK